MKLQSLQALVGSAALILAPAADASVAHRHLHHHGRSQHKHNHLHMHRSAETETASIGLTKRSTCQFPTDDDNLVAVTPDKSNGGWAMSPDQQCTPGSYCPYACKPGMVMAQWQEGSTYVYPQSMNGGLYCDNDGTVSKPFPNKPYCVDGTGSVKAVNKCAQKLSFCQTVLPGNEAMIIPTLVNSISTLAVPDPSYWDSTAAHFYINPPGTGSEDCIWGTSSKAIGNWAAYVAGTNTDANGQTFVKIGMNPVYEASGLKSTKPDYGVKIECPDGGCNGLPCQIQPGGGVESNQAASGAGGSNFCVVTVAKGKTAHIVAFDGSGGNGGSDEETSSSSKSPETEAPSTPSSSSSPPPPPPTTSEEPKTSSTPPPPPTTSSSVEPSTTMAPTSSKKAYPTVMPGIFHENTNSTTTSNSTTSSSSSSSEQMSTTDSEPATNAPEPTHKDKDNEAGRQQGSAAMAGLVVAFVAAACLF